MMKYAELPQLPRSRPCTCLLCNCTIPQIPQGASTSNSQTSLGIVRQTMSCVADHVATSRSFQEPTTLAVLDVGIIASRGEASGEEDFPPIRAPHSYDSY